jgi:predicted AAA+ superfamily ATPase
VDDARAQSGWAAECRPAGNRAAGERANHNTLFRPAGGSAAGAALASLHHNAGKRLVKAPKVYARDGGVVHALLGIPDHNTLAGHPVVGTSWEGFVIENLIAAAPELTIASFYRTSAGAEIDLVLEMPGQGLWAIDVKRGLSARPEKGFYNACEDLQPVRRFVVNSGTEGYVISAGVDAIGVRGMASLLAAL